MAIQRARTDYILSNVLPLLKAQFYTTTMPILPPSDMHEENVLERVLEYCKIVYKKHVSWIFQISSNFVHVETNRLEELLTSLYEQIFADRISWYRIMLFIGVVADYMVYFHSNNILFHHFYDIVRKNLLSWIEDHNGWETIEFDEPLFEPPSVNLDSAIFRRSERLAGKEEINFEKYFCDENPNQ